ncbi:MAG: T9SS type A sorting domain-containing protein [Bacteroidia bacterium]|nr:T9SS type A sorting domain-containing protein [Bacteroidia bacterium]
MRFLAIFLVILSLPVFLFSQTGPAGVGTSATNVFWLKADAGTSSSVNATPISSWNDASGNGMNVAQTVAVQQPSFAANVINGFPAIQFDNNGASGQNDKMLGPDSPILDNTAGYTFFTVSRPQNFGDARVLVSKRTTVSVDQSFMLFYYTSNKFYVDIQTTNDRYATNTVYTVNNNYLIDVVYDGTLTSANRSKTYNEQALDITATETSSFVPDNASPIIIGTTDASDPRPYGGYISEIIIYRQALTTAPKIIVDNYLSAKYNIALSANDKYTGDNPGNGNYDREVAGIGKESTGSNPSFSASISGGLTVSSNSGLDNGDYILAGHASLANYQTTVDIGGISGPNPARWLRIWYADVTNTSTTINTNVEFDMSDGGVGTVALGPTNNYVLLFRASQTGNWTEVATANTITGDRIIFNNFVFIDDGYYTIGTKNYNVSPLPINLVSFEANRILDKVALSWTTFGEKENDKFIIQKTKNGLDFEEVVVVPGAGTNSALIKYNQTDYAPYEGVSYYRLAHVSKSGKIDYSQLVAVDFYTTKDGSIKAYCDMNGKAGVSFVDLDGDMVVTVNDLDGKLLHTEIITNISNDIFYPLKLSPVSGMYIISARQADKVYSQKIIIK